MERAQTNAILAATGLELLPTGKLAEMEDRRLPLEYLQAEIAAYPWPCMIMNDLMEIMAWNAAAERVTELDFAVELPLPYQRNLMRIAAMPHFRERVQNWDEAVTALVPVSLRATASGEDSATPRGPRSVMTELRAEDALAAARLEELWRTAPGTMLTSRVVSTVAWRRDEGEVQLFNATISPWTVLSGLWAIDWHPANTTSL